MNVMHNERGTFRGEARRLLAVVLAVAPLLAGCSTDEFLKVSAPGKLPADNLETPAEAGLLVNGAISDFECAVGSFDMVEGIISDEFSDAQLGAAGWDYDRRTANQNPGGSYGVNSCTSNQTPGIYTPVSIARWSADNALTKLQGWTADEVGPTRDSLITAAALYAGLSYAMLGMSMCDAAIDVGPQQNQQQLFADAEERFTTAITTAGSSPNLATLVNAALVGRARVRLYQGNLSGADADARAVPAGFAFYATASDVNNRRYNRVYSSNVRSGFYTVEDLSRNLTTEGMPDPRAKVEDGNFRGADGQDVWIQTKYTSLNDPIRVASWDEAQLIAAEAEGGTAAIQLINGLRDEYGIPHYSGPTDDASIKQLIIDERRKTLFAEGFRNYDIQRFQIPFDPPVGAEFPDKGGVYGNTTCLPLPNVERFNNPNITS